MSDSNIATPQYCAYHPKIETALKCKRCEKYICSKCAIPTPTGYLCKDCEREQQKKFDTATQIDYIIACVISLLLSFIGSIFVNFLGFFVIIFSPIFGVVISEIIRFLIKNRRSIKLTKLITFCIVIGAVPWLLFYLSIFDWISCAYQAIYLFFCATTVYQRMKGISI